MVLDAETKENWVSMRGLQVYHLQMKRERDNLQDNTGLTDSVGYRSSTEPFCDEFSLKGIILSSLRIDLAFIRVWSRFDVCVDSSNQSKLCAVYKVFWLNEC